MMRRLDVARARLRKWPTIAVNKAVEKRPRSVEAGDIERFHDILSGYDQDIVFAHVGLSDVAAAFDGNPYEVVLGALEQHFESVLAPGFTDYFRTSGVFDKQHSRPKHGTFVRLFLDDAMYRTDDACKSILVSGDYRFDGCNHRDSYALDGCFERLREDNVLNVSIGTSVFRCSYLHHLEAKYGAPYMVRQSFPGVMHDRGETTEIEQHTHYYTDTWSFNKMKLSRELSARGILGRYDFGGLRLYTLPVRQLDSFIAEKMNRNPYYLVS
jgi:aminoglycoside N3'-acetyltransferase